MNNKSLAGPLTATKLRILLIAAVVLLLLAQGGLIVLGQNAISAYGSEVSSAVAQSSSNEKTLRDLQSVSTALQQRESTVDKSKRLIASKNDETYTYQNQIIQDITRYAERSGLSATGFAFTTADAAAGGATAPAPPAPAAGGAAPVANIPPGVTPVNVTVTFAAAGSYESFYKFLQLLEGNLLRMKIDGLNLSRPASDATDSTGITSLTIQAYTQK